MGYLPYQLVQDLLHQQYCSTLIFDGRDPALLMACLSPTFLGLLQNTKSYQPP